MAARSGGARFTHSGAIYENLVDIAAYVEGALGAIEARLQTAVSNLQSMTENFRAAESRITDADIGEEAANLERTQMVQQAASAILEQANQAPALALTLLG